MHADQIFIYVNDRRTSLADFLAMDKSKVVSVDASGCTALTSVDLPAAKTVYARGCTALTSVDLPAAEYVDASGCTALTSVIDVGKNARGYDMFAIKLLGEWRVIAGCRNFNLADAHKHWGEGPRKHGAILVQVEEIAAEIEKREAAEKAVEAA